jgi:hypothetical protein
LAEGAKPLLQSGFSLKNISTIGLNKDWEEINLFTQHFTIAPSRGYGERVSTNKRTRLCNTYGQHWLQKP